MTSETTSTLPVFKKVSSKAPTLEEAQQFVGGYVELVHLPGGGQLLVNEDGHRLNLPFNKVASQMYGGPIVGNVMWLTGVARWK